MKLIFKTLFLSLCIIANTHLAYAQTASILPPAKTTFFDQNGKPLTAGTVDFYTPSTTTRKTTWQDAAESIPNANPVVLDAGGRALILGSGSYRQVVKDRNGNLIWDQVTASAGTSGGGVGTGDGTAVGTLMPFAGMIAPVNYAFAYGQELNRTTYSSLLAAITNSFSAVCVSGSPTLTGLTDTTQLNVGANIEGACVAPSSTIISKTSTSVTMNNNAIIGVTTSVTFFNFGNGNASTTFNLPDLRGYSVVGRCNMGGANCSQLTSTYFGTDPNSTGAKGGSQNNTLLTANLPPYTPAGTIANGAITSTAGGGFIGGTGTLGTVQGTGGGANVPINPSNVLVTSTQATSTFTGTAAAGQTSTPFSNISPEITLNYVIKVFPDTAGGGGGGGSGVTSIGGQSGIILCGGGLTCAANTISATGFSSQNANLVFAGPTTGSPATPTFRSLTLADLPSLGTISSQNANAVAITGGTIAGTALSGNTITGGTISGSAAISGSTITTTGITGGTISGAAISTGTVTGAAVSGGTIASATISGSTITTTPINASGGNITNVITPTNAGDAANKSYVDSVAGTGVNPLPSSKLATAAILPNTPSYANGTAGVGATLTAGSNSSLTVDGTVASISDVILVKNQASAFQNGVYTVTTAGNGATPWVLTRATYYDQAAEMKNNSFTVATVGSTNANSSWIMSPAVTTVGTDPSNWTLFSSSNNSVAIGTTTISGGTSTKVLFDNAGVAGEYTISGTGNVAMTTSPTITTPTLSTPTISSPTISGTITAPNLVTNTILAQGGAATIKGNPTTGTANEQDFTLSGLTARTVPDLTNDQMLIYNSASGALNKVTPTALGIGTGGVTSIAGNSGAFTLNSGKGITNATNSLQTTFTQTGTGAVATDLVARTKQLPVTPWDFTASTIDNGSTSATAAIQAALNTGRSVYLPTPATCYLVDADLTFTVAGQELFGDGRGVPTLCIKSNVGFTNGVLKCAGLQPGPNVRDMAVTFTQPFPTPAATTTGTISGGTTLTLASGTGVAVNQAVGPIGAVQSGLTLASGAGTVWTLAFAQPNYSGPIYTYNVATLRGQLTQYKPFMYCQGSARASVRHVLINGSWDAFDFRGNSGGLEMLDVQFSAYNKGIQLDGSLDTVRLTDVHCWPFGVSGTQYDALVQTPGIPSAAAPLSGSMCGELGRVDGMIITGLTTAQQLGLHLYHGTGFTVGDPTVTCNGCDFDTFNGVIQDAGNFTMNGGAIGVQTGVTGYSLSSVNGGTRSSAYFNNVTSSSQTYGSLFLMQSCTNCVLNIDKLNMTGSVNMITMIGIAASVATSEIWLTNSYVNQGTSNLITLNAFVPTTGVSNYHISNNIIDTTPNTAFANPIFQIQGTCGTNVARVTMTNNRTVDKGTGGGTFISKACAQFDIITNNVAPGWTYTLPAGTGIYTGNL